MDVKSNFTRHARLVAKMADQVGVDLVEEMQRGQLDSEDLRVMVHRCQGCTEPNACEHQLNSEGFAAAPSYCRNSTVFETMKS